ncbi:hypothetical protein [Micromonospora costi]|uniref:Zinc permease n=1 Tax=Micromonospora costi TaxID=1530042 RepID=A0A3B0A5W1_9ACTN|nr:hypothetical protein [Micromonospora costi]RKN55236.1 hypothetical protein D7193_11045 [Micromonospora costi]
MTLTREGSLWATLLVALVLGALHLLAPHIRRRLPVSTHAATSLGGGIAAAYVFLYLLPRLAEGNQAVAHVLEETVEATPARRFILFLVALIGFFTFYVLERATHRPNGHKQEPTRVVFAFQLGFFALYSALITYTLATKLDAGLGPAVLFAVAMGLHVLATDGVLAEHFPVSLTTRWRLVLVAGAGGGWLTAVVAQPTGVLMNLLTAFLGGGILLNVFIDELTPERHSSLTWFIVGLAAYSGLLAIATITTSRGAA